MKSPQNTVVPHLNWGKILSMWRACRKHIQHQPSRGPTPSPAPAQPLGFLSLFNKLSLPGSGFLSNDMTLLPREAGTVLGFILRAIKPHSCPQAGFSLHGAMLGIQQWGAKGRSFPHQGPASPQAFHSSGDEEEGDGDVLCLHHSSKGTMAEAALAPWVLAGG